VAEATVRVEWHCGMFVGAPHWHGTEYYEPDECSTDFTTVVPKWRWEEGDASAECPSCHATLWQQYDHGRLAEEDGNA
jgi:hypothetical protein